MFDRDVVRATLEERSEDSQAVSEAARSDNAALLRTREAAGGKSTLKKVICCRSPAPPVLSNAPGPSTPGRVPGGG